MIAQEHHHQAMDLADQADWEKRRGNFAQAKSLIREAFFCERNAALSLKDKFELEPTRSVLFRSAASLAAECGELREAERLIAFALSGDPAPEIADELRDLLEQVNAHRHLELKGLQLEPSDLQLSIWGPAIWHGFAQSRHVRERIEKMETLAIRTHERLQGKPFRGVGRPTKEDAQSVEVYVSPPRAASFAVTLRIVRHHQLPLPGFNGAAKSEEVFPEVFDCLQLINRRDNAKLREKIGDESYYINFVSVAEQLAPDKAKIAGVGLTINRDGHEQKLILNREKGDWTSTSSPNPSKLEGEEVEIRGLLCAANSTKKVSGRIEVVEPSGAIHKIQVPLEQMADIVRPMYDYHVVVKGTRGNKGIIQLNNINLEDS